MILCRKFTRAVVRRPLNLVPAARQTGASDAQDAVRQKLVRALREELKTELAQYKMDSNLKRFLLDHRLLIKESANGSPDVTLRREVLGYNITVHFSARAPPTSEDADEDPLPFTIVLENTGEKLRYRLLAFDCLSLNNQIEVTGSEYFRDRDEFERRRRSGTTHALPFDLCAEKLQETIVKVLRAMGISKELAVFTVCYSEDRERRLYHSWLQNVADHLQYY
eukprot:TRINITY_DN10689_c0_g1_i2.p1 TRINITY_DN10689_c0_g1~~TRINITY_DN10689_c0_g1_i2.p1  ORF type:complete len:223 (-),score=35.25 TRINITY_DN10689_c0_g1_i2:452-1120(-)